MENRNKKILLVDDDEYVLDVLSMYLKKEGYNTELARDGEEALLMINEAVPHLVVLDLMLPKIDGIEVCREIRVKYSVPIIMLTAKAEDIDKIIGLELGADDYITKPFNPREVVARIRAVLRRTEGRNADKKEILTFPGLEVNLSEYKVKVKGEVVTLTPKEIETLWLMASHPGRVFTREQLLEQVWGFDFTGETRTVDTHIKRLRYKLKAREILPWKVKTIWGVGYSFEVE